VIRVQGNPDLLACSGLGTMSDIVLTGLSHKTAPVALRERLSLTTEETRQALEALGENRAIDELLIFSTCNRVETVMITDVAPAALEAVSAVISQIKNIERSTYENVLYTHLNEEAVRHVFRVASSLDSMVVGEPQILGQVKEAYRMATETHSSGVVLNRLLHRAFFVAKKVRNETGIGDHAVSISYAAIELARKIFGSLEGKKVLLIGAGEMAELAVEHLIQNRAGEILVANRTFHRAVDVAGRFNGSAISIEEIAASLKTVDIIISSTGSPDFMVTKLKVKESMRSRRNRPIFFIDIAVPRDIDPDINRLNNAYVYDIDDLKGVIEENIDERANEAVKGKRIVDEAVIKFQEWVEYLDVVPTIVALRKKFEDIADAEMKKTLSNLRHLPDSDQSAISKMTSALINKILHDPTLYLKSDGCHRDKAVYIDMARKLFNLDDE